MAHKLTILAVLLLTLAISIQVTLNRPFIEIAGKRISLEVADTDEARYLGLSYRDKLEIGTGLLFVFDSLDYYGITMREMRFSIDIVWFDQDGVIVHFLNDVTPETDPEVFYPPQKAKYVVELNANELSTQDIVLGTKAKLKL